MATLPANLFPVGIVGFGRIGAEHAGWIARSGVACVSAVWDVTSARRQLAASRGLPVARSPDELFETCRAVLVATPTAFHFADTMAALGAGRHVLVEKPMALGGPEARQMAAEAARQGKVLEVFQCRRWDADFLTVRRLVEEGRLGTVFNIESRLGQWASCVGPAAPEYRPGWRNERSFGGGGLYDWGSHFLDQLQVLKWPVPVARVFAQLRGNVWTSDCDDLARVCLDFADGTAALCEINTTTTRPLPRWHLDGTLGSADSPFSLAFDTAEWARLSITRPGGAVETPDPVVRGYEGSEPWIWQRFVAACRGDGLPAVGVESVLRSVDLLDAARTSAAEGRAVELR